MEFNKCTRCGNFYLAEGNVCPKCKTKDTLEYSTFKNYIQENGLEDGIDTISGKTGISVKNLNRFLSYEGLGDCPDKLGNISLKSGKIDL